MTADRYDERHRADYVSHNINTGITSRSTFAGLPTPRAGAF